MLGLWALRLLAVVPLGLAGLAAWKAPRAHLLLDYWHVLAKITDDDGTLIPSALFSYHLDQPFAVPSLLFWADAAFFGGDNRILTTLTVVLTAGIVLMLRALLPTTLTPTAREALTAGFAFLLLSSHAAELWTQATNGISWIPAVFLAVLAILLAHRGRFPFAYVAAALGCLCFGAALPVWFALAMTSWLRHDPRHRIATPAVIGIAVFALWFATTPAGPQSHATTAIDPDGRLSVLTAALGGLWSATVPLVAIIAGGATLAGLLLASRRTTKSATAPDAGWIGLGCYAVTVAALLACGRTTSDVPGGNVGLISRYVLVAALATSALLTLIVLRRPAWPARYAVVGILTVSLLTHAIGGTKADTVHRAYLPLQLAPVALRIHATAALTTLHIEPSAIPAAQALHAYPFTDDFTLGCGHHELGTRLDLTTTRDLPGPNTTGPTRGVLDTPGDTILSGWATINDTPPDCILVTDPTGTITGAGITTLPRPDLGNDTGWQAVAPPTNNLVVIAVSADTLYRITPTQR